MEAPWLNALAKADAFTWRSGGEDLEVSRLCIINPGRSVLA
jgi:hypothetical protein